ncbi:MAG: spermidine/putrescine ABC transporter substrate-binding protein [Acidimicrobiia bacterium]|nr:spermidine/putrescine ABC transporter substrate-binding protein [Acidimicrobiia bacterium]
MRTPWKRGGMLLAVIALIASACGGGSGDVAATGDCSAGETDGDLNFYNWTEYIDPDLIAAFEAEADVDVVETFYDSNEAMLAQIQSGVTYDLIVPSDYMVAIMVEEELLAPINKEAVPNTANLSSDFVNPPYDPTGEFTVAYQWGTTGLGVNLSVVGEDFAPSWSLLLDPDTISQYPGGVSVLNDPRETMGAALKYLGYSLNDTDIDHLQEAADLIADAKASIATFDSDQYDESLIAGEVAVAHGYSGNFFVAFDESGDPDNWAYVIPEEGGTVWIDNMAIPADSEHPCTAQAFINFLLDPENGATLTNWNYYASPNAAAEPFILEEILEDETIYPAAGLRDRLEIITDTGDYEINFTDKFAEARS